MEPTQQVPELNTTVNTPAVKVATPELILFKDELFPPEMMIDLVFEDIGGTEMISIARNDIINGLDVFYNPIKNLSSIYFQYNPQNVLVLQGTLFSTFEGYGLKFEEFVPTVGTGPNGEIIYIDEATGDLYINVKDLKEDLEVKVEIQVTGSSYNDTIYVVNA